MNLAKRIVVAISNGDLGENGAAIYGGAYHLVTKQENFTIDQVLPYLTQALRTAKFLEPNTKEKTIISNFCALIMLDPALLEVYLGVRF